MEIDSKNKKSVHYYLPTPQKTNHDLVQFFFKKKKKEAEIVLKVGIKRLEDALTFFAAGLRIIERHISIVIRAFVLF